MKIVSLEVENIKCLKAISITPEGNTIVIGGDNGNGKSSVLDSIEYALAGSKHIPEQPIRNGQEKARIVLNLDDIQVIRTFTKNGTHLVVKAKDGTNFPSPQDMLNKLLGDLSFDPSEFFRMDDKKRVETLKKLVGLDFTDLNNEYKKVFDQRTDVNRRGKELKAQFDAIDEYDDVPDEEVSVADLSKQLTDAMSNNQALEQAKRSVSNNEKRINDINEQIEALEEEKAKIERYIENDKAKLKKLSTVDISSLQEQISSSEEINKKVRDKQKRAKLGEELETLRDNSLKFTKRLELFETKKQEALENAKFPVKGLAFDEETVTFKGIPFNQISQAERIRISVAIGLVLNPTLKILLIRDASLLDDKNMQMVAAMAAKADAQIWLERVGKGKECKIIIEDGSICETE